MECQSCLSPVNWLESQTSKEAAWRSRLQRHAQSGKSIAAFCREEAVSLGTPSSSRTSHGSPAQPSAAQIGALRQASELALLNKPGSIAVPNGTASSACSCRARRSPC